MSNLVPIQQLNIPANETSALLAACRGELAGEELDLDLDLGEHDDLQGILPDLPILKVDGGWGSFIERDENPKTAPGALYGVILARQASKVFFPPRDRVLSYAQQCGFKALISDELKWICRNPNAGRPLGAELNPALSDEQREEAKRLKLGGATGASCVGCPANAGYEPDKGSKIRLCKDGENLIWLDSKREEPVVLNIIASSSVVSLQKYLKTCFSKGRALPLFRNLVKLSFKEEESDQPGVKNYYVLQVTNLQAVDKATLLQLAGAYKANLYMLERAGKRVDSMDGAGFEPHEGPVEEVSAGVLGGPAYRLGEHLVDPVLHAERAVAERHLAVLHEVRRPPAVHQVLDHRAVAA